MPKTILLVATFNASNRMSEFLSWINRLNPAPDKVVFCENNSTDGTLDIIVNECKVPYEIIRIWMVPNAQEIHGAYATIAHARQLLLTRARHLDPDYAIFVDDDVMVLTPDSIKVITDYKKDVVGGPYLRWFPEGLYLASKWKVEENKDGKYKIQLRDWIDKPIQPIHMTSGGFLCLSKKVIQDRRLCFYPLMNIESSEDFGFCLQCQDFDYKIYLDGTLRLAHLDRHRHRPWFVCNDGSHPTVKIGNFNYVKYEFEEEDDYCKVWLIPIFKKPKMIHEMNKPTNQSKKPILAKRANIKID